MGGAIYFCQDRWVDLNGWMTSSLSVSLGRKLRYMSASRWPCNNARASPKIRDDPEAEVSANQDEDGTGCCDSVLRPGRCTGLSCTLVTGSLTRGV